MAGKKQPPPAGPGASDVIFQWYRCPVCGSVWATVQLLKTHVHLNYCGVKLFWYRHDRARGSQNRTLF